MAALRLLETAQVEREKVKGRREAWARETELETSRIPSCALNSLSLVFLSLWISRVCNLWPLLETTQKS